MGIESHGPLRRPTEGRVFLGVCAGLGNHLGLDPVLVRVASILLAIPAGLNLLLAYFLCAWVMPAE